MMDQRLVLEHNDITLKMTECVPDEVKQILISKHLLASQIRNEGHAIDKNKFRFGIVCKTRGLGQWGYYMSFDHESYLYNGKVGIFAMEGDVKFIYYENAMKKEKILIIKQGYIGIFGGRLKRAYEREMLRKYDIMCPWLFPSYPDGCKNCKIKPYQKALKLCKGCKNVYYCSRHCQKIDWKYKHRNNCKTRWWHECEYSAAELAEIRKSRKRS